MLAASSITSTTAVAWLTAGALFIELLITTVPAELVQPFTVAFTEYVPEAARVTFEIVGFGAVDVKLLGPDQL